jgi:hypothetical protein
MTTISPASAHRPPNPPPSTSSLRSLKRHPSTIATEQTKDKPSEGVAEERPAAKRLKVESPASAITLSIPASSNPVPAPENLSRLARPHDARSLPLEFINGFFVGSEAIQESLPQSPVTSRPSPPQLPQRPWKHSLLARKMAEDTLNNTGVRRRNDMQVQSVPYKTEPPRDAPRFVTDSKICKWGLSSTLF